MTSTEQREIETFRRTLADNADRGRAVGEIIDEALSSPPSIDDEDSFDSQEDGEV